MSELITKILDLFRELLPMVIGWFGAKQDTKIETLKEENETLKEYDKIDNTIINDVYDSGMFSK